MAATAFPALNEVILGPGVTARYFEAHGTLFQVVEMAPGAALPPHSHPEAQAGIVLEGELTMMVGDEERLLKPLETAFTVAPDVPHGARNDSDSRTVSIDLKKITGDAKTSGFIDLGDVRKTKIGIVNEFFVGDWFEIMLSTLESGGAMPNHSHKHEQIGYVISGAAYTMVVGDETHGGHGPGDVYFAAPMVEHSAVNEGGEPSLNFVGFIPPRYHRPLA